MSKKQNKKFITPEILRAPFLCIYQPDGFKDLLKAAETDRLDLTLIVFLK